jgi:hypothetical protein
MATTYTQNEALGRAVERARQDSDAYCVYCNRQGDYIVRNAAAAPPREFNRLLTASYSDGSTIVIRFNS